MLARKLVDFALDLNSCLTHIKAASVVVVFLAAFLAAGVVCKKLKMQL